MQKAYDNISNTSGKANAEKLKETHLYVKFMPDNEKEYQILKHDSTLVLYNYPLDYEIKVKGNSYQDPGVPVGKPTYQYCSVETIKQLPKGVKYKVLAKLYIPQSGEGQFNNISNGRVSNQLLKDLEHEAFRLTNNLGDLKNSTSKNAKTSSYRPSGYIQSWDESKGQVVGIEGVEVRARRWFTTHVGYTLANGYYSCNGTFVYNCDYSIDWARYNFEIRDGWLSTACYNGPNLSSGWSIIIADGAQWFYSKIFRASYRYYYQAINGLRRPPENSFWGVQMHIRAFNEANSDINGSHCAACRFLGLGSAIKLYNPTNTSREIFGTTIHELGHASHWNMDSYNYNNGDGLVVETWARGVQWALTNLEYSNYTPFYYRQKGGSSEPYYNYTGVVQDMVDGIDGYDQVSDYYISQIENALIGHRTWIGWRDNIKNQYNNATENNLDNLYDYWGY